MTIGGGTIFLPAYAGTATYTIQSGTIILKADTLSRTTYNVTKSISKITLDISNYNEISITLVSETDTPDKGSGFVELTDIYFS